MNIEKLAKPFLKNIKPYKAGKPVEEAQRERQTDKPFIKLASNENPNPPHKIIINALTAALPGANRYPESGCYYLVREIAGRMGVAPEEIFIGNGSNEIIDLLVRAFVKNGENVIYPTPGFVVYEMVCAISGVERKAVPCSDFRIDLKAITEATDAETKMIFLCNPNNPTGTYFSSSELKEFLRNVPDNILVVVDEAYYEYVDADDYPDCLALMKERNTLIVLRTFSKFYSLAGIRVGFSVADKAVVGILHKVRQPFNVNRLAQEAARAALACEDSLRPQVLETIKERTELRKKIAELGCKCPLSQTNFLYVVPPAVPGDICEMLLDHGVIVRKMKPFGGG